MSTWNILVVFSTISQPLELKFSAYVQQSIMYLWYKYQTKQQWFREIIEKIKRSVSFDQGDIVAKVPYFVRKTVDQIIAEACRVESKKLVVNQILANVSFIIFRAKPCIDRTR
jgi:ribosomal protein L22